MIAKQTKKCNERILDLALDECLKRQLFSATEFVDMVRYLDRQRDGTVTEKLKGNQNIKPIHPWNESILQTDIHKRDVQEYVSVLEGDLQ